MASRRESSNRQHKFSLLNLSANEIYFEDYAVYCQKQNLKPSNDKLLKISHETVNESKQKGRLKVCSKSLVFVPNDIRQPMIRMTYKLISKVEDSKKNEILLSNSTIISSHQRQNCLIMVCSSITLMNEYGRIEPYTVLYDTYRFIIEFLYTNVEDCISVVGQLYRSSTLTFSEQTMMIESIIQGRLKMLKFDLSQLGDFRERIVFENDAYLIQPLVQNPGKIVLTDQRLYFHSLNNIEEQQTKKYDLSNIVKVTKRRYKFRSIGIEILFSNKKTSSVSENLLTIQSNTLYLVFSNERTCLTFHDLLLKQNNIKLDDVSQDNMTLRWQLGKISNFEYLLYLNDQSQRSFNDLTQYPIFPWVLSDYISNELDLSNPKIYRDLRKPVGALNQERLDRLKARYNESVELEDSERFLYGSFYSNPGFIVYFLVRLYPEFLLCLNGGRFDHSDRLFHSIADTFNSCLSSDSDVKELIPQFYMSNRYNNDDDSENEDGSFLVNIYDIDFGRRHDNTLIGNVILPPWAEDEKDFVFKMREALESDHVSEQLNHWIDLIFGYKQRGVEAISNDNLFHYLTYGVFENGKDNGGDTENIEDWDKRLAFETQVQEFGQVPQQLFDKPHPRKLSKQDLLLSRQSNPINPLHLVDDTVKSTSSSRSNTLSDPPQIFSNTLDNTNNIENDVNWDMSTIVNDQSNSGEEEQEIGHLESECVCRLHKNAINRIVQHSSLANRVISIADDGFLRTYTYETNKSDYFLNICKRSLTCLFVINVENELKEINSIAFIGSYDQSIYIYNLTNSLLLHTQKIHEDVIVDIYVSSKINSFPCMWTGSWDSSVRLWSLDTLLTIDNENNNCKFLLNNYSNQRLELSHIYEISLDSACTCLNVLEVHDLLAVGCHDSTILLCDLTTGQILKQWNSSSEDYSKIMSIQFHNDGLFLAYLCTTKLALIDIMTGTEVFEHSSSSVKFRSLFYSNNILIIGCNDGSIKLFSMKSSSFLPLSLHICDTAITTIAKHNHNMASDIYDKIYFFGTEDGSIHMYSMRYDNKTHV